MKKITGLAGLALMAAIILASASGAYAAAITFTNELDLRLSIALAYYDNDLGTLVTKGWWHVEPDGDTTITINADESKDIYYAAYNKDQFIDSSTRGNPKITRWASPHNFTYTDDSEPSDEGVWEGRFYKIGGSTVSVDGRTR
ncbi:MAG: DUF1036 domain-containing protein [Synergistaceae bacterium]|jgi:uncharacterized membrane protein|nr:DUF1036 domain-containing protein [Synergistaceae bacterium]